MYRSQPWCFKKELGCPGLILGVCGPTMTRRAPQSLRPQLPAAAALSYLQPRPNHVQPPTRLPALQLNIDRPLVCVSLVYASHPMKKAPTNVSFDLSGHGPAPRWRHKSSFAVLFDGTTNSFATSYSLTPCTLKESQVFHIFIGFTTTVSRRWQCSDACGDISNTFLSIYLSRIQCISALHPWRGIYFC